MAEIKNVLLFLSDQHRQDTLGCCGNPIVQTPNMDRLAASGVRFANAYTPAPTCTPARACLQTGMIAREHGLIFNPEFAALNGGKTDIPDDVPFFAQALKGKEFNLAHVGKWHIGHHVEDRNHNLPSKYGYEGEHYPGYGFPGPHAHYKEYLKRLGVDGFSVTVDHTSTYGHSNSRYSGVQEGPKEASVPYYLATGAIGKINRYSKEDKPFFISCNFWGPHTPYFLPQDVYGRYADADIPLWPNTRFNTGMSPRPHTVQRWGRLWGVNTMTEDVLRAQIGHYYDYITHIDECMGMVLKALENSGKAEETLIVYTTDHGASVGSHGMWDKGYGLYDCLVRIPMILSHPSFSPAVNDSNVTLLDLTASIMDAAGCDKQDDRQIGESLLPLCREETARIHGDAQIIESFGHTMPFAQRMVRTDRYKYIFTPNDDDELYDMQEDPHETRNIARSAPAGVVKEHLDRLEAWGEEMNDHFIKRWLRTSRS